MLHFLQSFCSFGLLNLHFTSIIPTILVCYTHVNAPMVLILVGTKLFNLRCCKCKTQIVSNILNVKGKFRNSILNVSPLKQPEVKGYSTNAFLNPYMQCTKIRKNIQFHRVDEVLVLKTN